MQKVKTAEKLFCHARRAAHLCKALERIDHKYVSHTPPAPPCLRATNQTQWTSGAEQRTPHLGSKQDATSDSQEAAVARVWVVALLLAPCRACQQPPPNPPPHCMRRVVERHCWWTHGGLSPGDACCALITRPVAGRNWFPTHDPSTARYRPLPMVEKRAAVGMLL